MSKSTQSILIFVFYTAVIVGTMYFSGTLVKKKSLYDQYLVSLEGITLPVRDIERSVRFYIGILDFRPLVDKASAKRLPIGVILPEKKRLYFRLFPEDRLAGPDEDLGTSTVTMVIKVKNGFSQLHQKLLMRSKQEAAPLRYENYLADFRAIPPETVSASIEASWGNEFVVRDADGHSLIFYQPRRRSGNRE